MKKKIVIFSVLVVAVLLTGCNSIELQSSWKDRTVIIDGNDEDWKDQKYYIREKNITVGVMNDERYLYLCFYPTNRKLSELLLKQGLTIWFNGEGKRKKDFGIKFPLGLKNMVKDRSKIDSNFRDIEPEMMEKMVNEMSNKLEILGSEKNNGKTVGIKNLVGVEIALGVQKGVFVYELKIPYKHNQVYSATIGAEPGSEICLYFETSEIDFEEMNSQMDNRPSSMDSGMSGGKGSGRGGGGRSGGSKEGSDRQTSSSLNAWVQIQLATQTLTE
ncbi:MAG: hypothetical protein KAS53_05025 [Candidatus Cloacimonetes bacterium]|nr:hypothetical protein [Candidatus Cloacimonadota bacterium]